jgi:hypothetical protein
LLKTNPSSKTTRNKRKSIFRNITTHTKNPRDAVDFFIGYFLKGLDKLFRGVLTLKYNLTGVTSKLRFVMLLFLPFLASVGNRKNP